ncbi:peptidase family C78-domain-containing protein [Flagelloscypha sp. PMI_526]|nr:peptidase family C78-domain-containing protein [Flagelloscypha sp. PMI_526]
MSYTLAGGRIEEDVQIVDSNFEILLDPCALCQVNMAGMSLRDKQQHYETQHPEGSSSSGTSSSSRFPTPSSSTSHTATKSFTRKESPAPFWHVKMDVAPPANNTPGLVKLLKRLLVKSHSKGKTVRSVLCTEDVVHIRKENFDRSWGCGYRNFMMACTALAAQSKQPEYKTILDAHPPPGVRNLQLWLENAWNAGYDAQGAAQLGGTIHGTNKWIGVSDLWVAFAYVGIPTTLIDFNLKHLKEPQRATTVIDWVVAYFDETNPPRPSTATGALSGEPAVITDKMPLILQRQGHSMLVVGYEVQRNGVVHLLIFDAFVEIDQDAKKAARQLWNASRLSSHPQEATTQARSTLHDFFPKGKRKERAGDENIRPSKRPRSYDQNDDIIVISDTEEDFPQLSHQVGPSTAKVGAQLDPNLILKRIRLAPARIKKEAWQILSFPLTAPLTKQEQDDAKLRIKATRIKA